MALRYWLYIFTTFKNAFLNRLAFFIYGISKSLSHVIKQNEKI
jgi:hypothetical protein